MRALDSLADDLDAAATGVVDYAPLVQGLRSAAAYQAERNELIAAAFAGLKKDNYGLRSMPVWKLLLGWGDRTHRFVVILLLIYNVVRGFLTYRVVQLDERFSRMGLSPPAEKYSGLKWLDLVTQVLMYVSIGWALYEGGTVMVSKVLVLS